MKYNKDIWSKMQEKLIQLVRVSSREGQWWAAGPWPHQWSGQSQVGIKYSLTLSKCIGFVRAQWDPEVTWPAAASWNWKKRKSLCILKGFYIWKYVDLTCTIWLVWQGGYFAILRLSVCPCRVVSVFWWQLSATSGQCIKWTVSSDTSNSDNKAWRLQQGDHWQNTTNILVSNLIMSHPLHKLWLEKQKCFLEHFSFIMQHHPQCNEDYKDKEDESNNNCLSVRWTFYYFLPYKSSLMRKTP